MTPFFAQNTPSLIRDRERQVGFTLFINVDSEGVAHPFAFFAKGWGAFVFAFALLAVILSPERAERVERAKSPCLCLCFSGCHPERSE